MDQLSERKAQLLHVIVEHYIQKAEPVGSAFLVKHADFDLSGATMRNEMRDLEELGFLTHPHTSAGRIPTELGYRYYVEHLMTAVQPQKSVKDRLAQSAKEHQDEKRMVKALAKHLALDMQLSVIVGIDRDAVYYTGISNFFAQPEFRTFAQSMNVSSMFDHLDERMEDILSLLHAEKPRVLLGQENPLGNACGCVVIPFGKDGFFSLIGPMRMDYGNAVGLLEFVKTVL